MRRSALHLSCQEVVDLVSDYLEHVLSTQDAALFEQHLNFCDGCVAYVDQVRATVDRVGALRAVDVPADVRAQLLAAFRGWKAG